MKAWEIARDLYENAVPVVLEEEDQTWAILKEVSKFYDQLLSIDWASNVPGSGAPEKIMVAAVQALENRGYEVKDSERLLKEGMKAHKEEDYVKLHKITAELKHNLLKAEKNEESSYWKFKNYESFEEYNKEVKFPEKREVDVNDDTFKEKIKAAWLSQLIGAAMGTQVEGYTSENLFKTFGEVKDYIREPNTYNDDITFELALLEAFEKYGYNIESRDIALEWVGYVPSGWSAEEIALRNIKSGIMPPESGSYNNPFNEWIGAQMRGAICGMLAPGDPKLAAELAWKDGEVSHISNGILGEVLNAVMTSMSFVEKDVKKIVETAVNIIPKDSEYYSVVKFALDKCKESNSWQEALKACDERYKKYNWIHTYPNACAEIIALWFGEGDYEETLYIVTMSGIDVDCNAAQIMPIIGIQKGIKIIPERLIHPAFNKLITYMRDYEELTLDELIEKTVRSIKKAKEK
ncbi:MAG: ADP-ribosylglycohydrolase family protein [Bacillota bacterium]|nr:ADP-ribosylglycohydrolase family protein [Bacillota bacterium]